MKSKDVANAFAAKGAGVGAVPMGLDAAKGGTTAYTFDVVGTAPAGAVTKDQAAFFSQQTDLVIDATHALAASITPDVARFTNAQVGRYLTDNPQELTNINIVGADSAPTVASMIFSPVRFTPDGSEQTERLRASQFQNAKDFQTTRVNAPMSFVIDGWSFLRIVNTANATPASYTATFTFGPTMDQRALVTQTGPRIIASTSQ